MPNAKKHRRLNCSQKNIKQLEHTDSEWEKQGRSLQDRILLEQNGIPILVSDRTQGRHFHSLPTNVVLSERSIGSATISCDRTSYKSTANASTKQSYLPKTSFSARMNLIGTGGFAQVYCLTNTNTNTQVAVKIVDMFQMHQILKPRSKSLSTHTEHLCLLKLRNHPV